MPRPPYLLTMPDKRTTASVFASPHSGREYPWGFIRGSQLNEKTIRSSEDAFVDKLFAAAPENGAPLLSTAIPRAYVDLNRGADELDPALITGVKQTGHNPRISSGLGVIPRVVANGREIRQGKIGMSEVRERLNTYYHPYHNRLKTLLNESRRQFGFALLFDCHSMPHEALVATSYAYDKRPEVVLGDRFGSTADHKFMDETEQAFLDAGLRVSRNLPFAGAFVTQHYGHPSLNHHVIQIEIDRSLYLNEAEITPSADFTAFRDLISGVVARLADVGRSEIQLAAE